MNPWDTDPSGAGPADQEPPAQPPSPAQPPYPAQPPAQPPAQSPYPTQPLPPYPAGQQPPAYQSSFPAEPDWSARTSAQQQPLPVCDYTGESDAPCEEPATVKRWSSAAVVMSASLGAVVGGILVAAGIVWAFGLVPLGGAGTNATNGAPVTQTKLSITPNSANLDIAEAVAKKAVPSVVNVTIQQAVVDPFTGSKSYQDLGNGSGIIIRPDGYILTNYHVVNGADQIVVNLGVETKIARVVGVDPSTDIAVIKIDGSGYPAIEIGSSKALAVGQWVMAVGSPFGLEKTVTSGIVSALQRSEQAQSQTSNDITTYTNLIQTDAAINPGNSGGALVDEQGKLVGLNSLIQSPSGGVGAAQSAGIGFAIPVDFAIDIANQLIASGHATHPYMGVSTQTVDESVAAQYGLKVKSGALVRFVSPGSPAQKAGVKSGDIITMMGGIQVTNVSDVFAGIRSHKIGEAVPLEVVRNGSTLKLSVTLGSDSTPAK